MEDTGQDAAFNGANDDQSLSFAIENKTTNEYQQSNYYYALY